MGTSVPKANEGRKERQRMCDAGEIGLSVFRRDKPWFSKQWRILAKGRAHTAAAEAPVFDDSLMGDRVVEKAFEVSSREDALEESSNRSI